MGDVTFPSPITNRLFILPRHSGLPAHIQFTIPQLSIPSIFQPSSHIPNRKGTYTCPAEAPIPSPARQANKPKPPPTISLCTALRRVGFTGCSPVSLSRMSCGERSAGRTGPGERGHTHTGIHIDTVHNTRARCLLPCAAAVGAVNSRCACPVRICRRPRKAR